MPRRGLVQIAIVDVLGHRHGNSVLTGAALNSMPSVHWQEQTVARFDYDVVWAYFAVGWSLHHVNVVDLPLTAFIFRLFQAFGGDLKKTPPSQRTRLIHQPKFARPLLLASNFP